MSPLAPAFDRPDAREKVTGSGLYTGDLALTGMLHARFLLADRASARIRHLDLAPARAQPGVVAICQDDVPAGRYGDFVRDRTLFARDAVRFEGEIVAAVAARTPEAAAAALAAIKVEYEPLPVVADAEAALGQESPLVHDAWEGYDALDGMLRAGNLCSVSTTIKGDADAAFAAADVVVAERYVTDMSHPVPIEPHTIVAHWQADQVTIWSSTQVPFMARRGVAETLQLSESQVRVIVPLLGGGFGGKCGFHFEAHIAALARAARRPVRLALSRREEFLCPDKVRHPIVIAIETAARSDGVLLGRRARIVLDCGAYAADTPVMTELTTMLAVGPYRIPDVDVEARAAYTNRTPTGSTRAPTGPQMCWALEQHMDVVAERLGLDPYELRVRNLVEEGDEGPTRQIYEHIGAQECLRRATELLNDGEPPEADEGIGFACGFWTTMSSPSGAHVRLHPDGTGTIITGAQENGTGAVMALPLIAAEELDLPPETFTIVAQDTDVAPWDYGSAGSQTTANNGRAVAAAAAELRGQLLAVAESELEIAAEDLELGNGVVSVRGSPEVAISVARLAAIAHGRGAVLWGRAIAAPFATPEYDISGCVGRFHLQAFTAPTFFCHAARVRVDRQTGIVRVLEVAAAHDFGRVLNPRGAEGQVEGGVAHGIGIALLEGTQSRDGLQLNPSLLDYKLQTAADTPPIRIAFVDAPARDGGPKGSKGVGEPPMVPTAAAIGNAIARATGIRVRSLPMSPERVWQALAEAEGTT